jgi:hypothetical protein
MSPGLAYCADQAARSIDRANWLQFPMKLRFPARRRWPDPAGNWPDHRRHANFA